MISGERINLIALDDKFSDLILKWVNEPELKEMIGTRFPISRYEHEIWFKNRAMDQENKTFLIEEKTTKKIIGLVGNTAYDPINRFTYIHTYLGEKEDRSKGFGTETIRLYTKFCFNYLNIHKMSANIFEYNLASQKMFEKCGYHEEGILRKHWYRSGMYHDVVLMSIIDEES